MKTFEAHTLVMSVRNSLRNASLLQNLSDMHGRREFIQNTKPQVVNLLACCKAADLLTAAISVERLLIFFEAGISDDLVAKTLEDAVSRAILIIEDELSINLFFRLSPERKRFFDNPTEGWAPALTRFADASFDVEEMSKCYALARYPSAVFHSVSAIEVGLIELGVFLKISDPKSGWTSVTGKLNTIMKKKWSDLSAQEQKHHTFLEQVDGVTSALKSAWRNKISHAQGRLVVLPGQFDPGIAEEIMMASRSFMNRLAVELPQLETL